MGITDIISGIIKPDAPWLHYYMKHEKKLKMPDKSIYQHLKDSTVRYGFKTAYNYFGKTASFNKFMSQIDEAARAFRSQGIRVGDVVTICMPNTPEAVICFYALNKIGAISNMIHPLSAEQEIKNYLITNNSVMLVMADFCYEKVKDIIDETNIFRTIVVSVRDSMPFLTGFGYTVTKGYKVKKPPLNGNYIYWNLFILRGKHYNEKRYIEVRGEMPAVILHSGGTTGTPKGIVLSNNNFNAIAEQIGIIGKRNKIVAGDRVLSILPIFHGFGLGVSIHAPLCLGVTAVILPQFDAKEFDKLLRKYKPNILFGVPTLYEALANTNTSLDLSFIKLIVCGGDSLSEKSARRINSFLAQHHCQTKIAQGYGMTESLAAVAFAIGESNKDNSIGIPLPGNYIKIVDPKTQERVSYGQDGEICISGPTVMMGYLDNEKETNEMLRLHHDGRIWLHTGDIGYMDNDGVLFYKQRLKRMIISSGYNVYPSHVEQVIEEHDSVLNCTVVGISHPYKVEVPKAFIVLNAGTKVSSSIKKSIMKHCEEHLAKFEIPYEFEFRKSLPKTKIGKIDFKRLQEEEEAKLAKKQRKGK